MNKYPTYKPSNNQWIGDIPNHWSVASIKYLVDTKVTDGPHETPVFIDEGIPFISVESIKDSKIDFNFKRGFISKEQHEEYSKKCLPKKDDVFIVKSGSTTGKVAIVDTDLEFNIWSPLALIRCNQKKVLPKFSFIALQSDYFQRSIQQSWSFGTQPNIGMGVIENLKISLPPLQEQQAIVSYLDEKTALIDELILKKERKIELLKEQRAALINQAVTKGLDETIPMKDSGIEWIGEVPEYWEVKNFNYLLNLEKGLTITKENLVDEGVFCVNYGEIHSKFGFLVNPTVHQLKCVSDEYLESNPNSLLSNGDFIFADTSEDIEGSGNFTFLDSNIPVFAGYHTIIARPKSQICSKFFAYEFDSLNFRNQIRCRVKGIKVYSITQTILKELKLWIPSLSEQQAIVAYLDEQTALIDKNIELESQKIEKLKEYRQSLISNVVTGKVKVIE